MNKKEYFSLLVGKHAIDRIKDGKMKRITHKTSKRWTSAFRGGYSVIKFFENKYGDSIKCLIVNRKIIKINQEWTIDLEIKPLP